MCDPLRTIRGNPRVPVFGVSHSLSLSPALTHAPRPTRSSTVMITSDAHAVLPSRPHTSHMVACDVNEPRASTHSALPPEQPHAVMWCHYGLRSVLAALRIRIPVLHWATGSQGSTFWGEICTPYPYSVSALRIFPYSVSHPKLRSTDTEYGYGVRISPPNAASVVGPG